MPLTILYSDAQEIAERGRAHPPIRIIQVGDAVFPQLAVDRKRALLVERVERMAGDGLKDGIGCTISPGRAFF